MYQEACQRENCAPKLGAAELTSSNCRCSVFERSASHKDLEAIGKPEFKEFLTNLAEALGKAETLLASLRTNLAQAKDTLVSSDKADCSSLKKLLEVDTNNGSMHLDGLKALRKRLKTFMT